MGSYSWVVGQPSGSPRQIQNAQMHNANDGSGKPRGLVLNLDPVERIAAIDDAVASREMRSIRIVMKATGQPSSGARLFFRDMSLNALVQPGRSRVGDAFDVSHVSGQVYVADREGVVSVEWPTATTTGIGQVQMPATTSGSSNAASSEAAPPHRATTTTSTAAAGSSRNAAAIAAGASGPAIGT